MEPLLLPWMLAGKRLDSIEKSVSSEFAISLSKPPQFRLISYSTRDFAEITRLTLAYANIEFEDIKIENIKKWNKIKKENFPAKSLPMLEWNGKQIYGSDAIGRLVAKLFNLAGDGIYEQAQADTIIGVMRDFDNIAISYIKGVFALYKIDKEKTYQEIFKPAVIHYFTILEEFASTTTRDGFLLSSGISYADFGMANLFELINSLNPELVEKYINIKALSQKVFALPQLQYYLNIRPALAHLKPSPVVSKLPLTTNYYTLSLKKRFHHCDLKNDTNANKEDNESESK